MKNSTHNNKGENPRPKAGVANDSELLSLWAAPAIILVDLDAFFAAVEQLDHPAWRGKPLIVGGDPSKRGVVSTASYEAREYGIHSAMASSMAQRLCPNAIWTHGNHARYKEMSSQVMDILYAESPHVQQVSIDEAFVDISPTQHNLEHPILVAQRIQDNIEKLGITASIGLGTSKTIAKIASDIDKPRGITVVYPGREREFLAPLPVRTLSGIGAKSEKELHRYGIETLKDIVEAGREFMEVTFGKSGTIMYLRALGKDDSPLTNNDAAKSISHEISFALDLTDEQEICGAIRAISAKVGRRLRMKNLKGNTISLKIRYDDRSIRNAQKRLTSATDDDLHFASIAINLLEQLWKPGMSVRLLGVAVSGFAEETPIQDQLFIMSHEEDIHRDAKRQSNLEVSEKSSDLLNATDHVKDRFGEKAIRFGYEIKTNKRTTGSSPKNPSDYR